MGRHAAGTGIMRWAVAVVLVAAGAVAAPKDSATPVAVEDTVPLRQNPVANHNKLDLLVNKQRDYLLDLMFKRSQFRQINPLIPAVVTSGVATATSIATTVLLILMLTGVLEPQSSPYNTDSPFGNRVREIVQDNPNALADISRTILPSVVPLVLNEDEKNFDVEGVTKRMKSTAVASIEGIDGNFNFAHISPDKGEEATVVTAALEGFDKEEEHVVTLHRSGDIRDGCTHVGDPLQEFTGDTFTTDSKGRSVLLLHEPKIALRGSNGIMGRSIVVKNVKKGHLYCGVVINA